MDLLIRLFSGWCIWLPSLRFLFSLFCLLFAFLKEEVESSIRVCCVSLFIPSLFADCKITSPSSIVFEDFQAPLLCIPSSGVWCVPQMRRRARNGREMMTKSQFHARLHLSQQGANNVPLSKLEGSHDKLGVEDETLRGVILTAGSPPLPPKTSNNCPVGTSLCHFL